MSASISRIAQTKTSLAIAGTSDSTRVTVDSTVPTSDPDTRLATTSKLLKGKLDYNQNHIYAGGKLLVSGVDTNIHSASSKSTISASSSSNYKNKGTGAVVSSNNHTSTSTNTSRESETDTPHTAIHSQSQSLIHTSNRNSKEREPGKTDVNEDRISSLSASSRNTNKKKKKTSSKKQNNQLVSPLEQHFEKQKQQHPLPPQSKKYPTTPISKMSASRRKSRYEMSQSEELPQGRRRNFSFMRSEVSPRRRRVSSATLEKTRAHAKKLALLAAANHTRNEENQQQQQLSNIGSFDSQYSQNTSGSRVRAGSGGGSSALKTTPRKPGLNFSAFETDSCISANTSVYDMDFIDQMPSFDDTASSTSFFSNASNFSTGSSSFTQNNNQQYLQQQQQQQHQRRNKNKLEMYNNVNRSIRNAQFQQQQQQYSRKQLSQSLDMFPNGDSLEYSAFSNASSFQANFQQQQQQSPNSMQHQQQQHLSSHNDSLNRSNLSTVNLSTVSNTSSTISGAAAVSIVDYYSE